MALNYADVDLTAYLNRLMERTSKFRGDYLTLAVAIENLLTDLLLRSFAGNLEQRRLLQSIVFDEAEATFSVKCRMLEKLISIAPIEGVDKSLVDGLGKVRRLRNHLAHDLMDTSDEFTKHRHEDRIQLAFVKDGMTKQVTITLEEMRPRLVEASDIARRLGEVQARLSAKTGD